MPQYSSKNYYKAELEEYYELERKGWDVWEHEYEPWHYTICAPYCYCHEYSWNSAFDTAWVKYKGKYEPPKREYPHCDVGHDFCYEYYMYTEKYLIKEYFTSQEILETLQDHLKQKNCWCYERIQSHIWRRRVSSWLRPRCSSSVVYMPLEYEENVLTPCVIKILSKRLRNLLEGLHNQMELNEKIALLKKYGVSLQEYHQKRIERRSLLEKLQKPKEENQQPPKQKFYKVRIKREELFP